MSLTEHPPTPEALAQHVSSLRVIRRALHGLWLDGVRLGSASVNLPSLFKGYSGRVVESMAAGVPVVSWDAPHRPANRSLFAPDREIRLFERNDAETLAGHLRDLAPTPQWRSRKPRLPRALSSDTTRRNTASSRSSNGSPPAWIGCAQRRHGAPTHERRRAMVPLPETYRRREEATGIAAARGRALRRLPARRRTGERDGLRAPDRRRVPGARELRARGGLAGHGRPLHARRGAHLPTTLPAPHVARLGSIARRGGGRHVMRCTGVHPVRDAV